MAVYKVLQDIEGEDKLIAWLTPKQTIYAAIVIVSCVLAYFMGRLSIFLAIPWLFPILAFGFLAAPLGRDQPNDVWLAAQIRFYLKNRKRIWDQTGMQELVHITVPKRVEKFYTDGLNQIEVKSRLRALSTTLDSRGWAVKNTAINMSTAPQFAAQIEQQQNDDRLIGADSLPKEVSFVDVNASDDIMDEQSNIVAQRFDKQIKLQEELRKQALKEAAQNGTLGDQISEGQQALPPDYYFMREQQAAQVAQQVNDAPQTQYATFNSTVVTPGQDISSVPTVAQVADDKDATAQALLEKIHKDQEMEKELEANQYHGRVLKTPAEIAEEERQRALLEAEQRRIAAEEERRKIEQERLARREATQTAPDAIIKELSQASDLKVSTIEAQAKHAAQANNDGEVVVSLH